MDEKIELQKLKEEYPDVFENIPNDIVKVILSDETSLKISGICLKNGVEDEVKIERISYLITLALLGKLPIEELNATMEKELKTSQDVARKIRDEINQDIFSKIKDSLEKLYKKELGEAPIESKKPTQKSKEEALKRPPSKDAYREKIE